MGKLARVEVICAVCQHPFFLRPEAVARRRERTGEMLCNLCIHDRWLWGKGRGAVERLLQDMDRPTGASESTEW